MAHNPNQAKWDQGVFFNRAERLSKGQRLAIFKEQLASLRWSIGGLFVMSDRLVALGAERSGSDQSVGFGWGPTEHPAAAAPVPC